MKILVIPDVHLKPWMFVRAAEIMRTGTPDRAVCLMDIPDDWRHEFHLELYRDTYDSAIDFQKEFPDTLWCYGNHDMSYVWGQLESGYSQAARNLILKKQEELAAVVPDGQMNYIHRIDNVLFLHGGLTEDFVVRQYLIDGDFDEEFPDGAGWYDRIDTVTERISGLDVDDVIERMNGLDPYALWRDDDYNPPGSPIWHRPQPGYSECRMFLEESLLQVVGHTPVERIRRDGNVISCDVFSTYADSERTPIGTQEFPLIDTETWECDWIRGV